MDIEVRIFSVLDTILYILIILTALLYSIPIICIRRFHQPNNILTLNICLAVILCCFSWFSTAAIFIFNTPYEVIHEIMFPFHIAEMLLTIQVPFSFVVASIHRYYFVIYHTKVFFRRKQWIILCIGCQWSLGFILTMPNLICVLYTSCVLYAWSNVYTFVNIVMIPSIMCFIINMFIYQHVRSSSRRVQPQIFSNDIQQSKMSRRDIFLIRHMILMFCIFVGGWAPVYIIPIINEHISVSSTISAISTVWCELALLLDIINLFLYNHELRNYLKDICLRLFWHD